MTPYELNSICISKWSLVMTIIYDILTFGLLCFVAYESIIRPKIPILALSLQSIPLDTDTASWRAQFVDLMIDNKGADIKNVKITSTPDEIGWGTHAGVSGVNTSSHFHSAIPFISKGERLSFFWCDMSTNTKAMSTPITIIVEYDNPIVFPKRKRSILHIDPAVYKGIYWGINNKYDIHNVAEELNRLRNEFKAFRESYFKDR